MVNPPSLVTIDVVEMDPLVVNNYQNVINDLVTAFRLSDKQVVVQSTRSAKQVIVDYYNEIAERRKQDLKDVAGFAARWHEQACRITLILHAAKHRANAGTQEIQEETARAAVEIAKWFANEQVIILNSYRGAAGAQ